MRTKFALYSFYLWYVVIECSYMLFKINAVYALGRRENLYHFKVCGEAADWILNNQ